MVYVYVDEENDIIRHLCTGCAADAFFELEQVALAGDWEMCEMCEEENIPPWY